MTPERMAELRELARKGNDCTPWKTVDLLDEIERLQADYDRELSKSAALTRVMREVAENLREKSIGWGWDLKAWMQGTADRLESARAATYGKAETVVPDCDRHACHCGEWTVSYKGERLCCVRKERDEWKALAMVAGWKEHHRGVDIIKTFKELTKERDEAKAALAQEQRARANIERWRHEAVVELAEERWRWRDYVPRQRFLDRTKQLSDAIVELERIRRRTFALWSLIELGENVENVEANQREHMELARRRAHIFEVVGVKP